MELSNRLKAIYNEIMSMEVKLVSFDVFDTLLLRPCLNPMDIFRIVKRETGYEGPFEYLRRMAEVYARKNKPYYIEDVTIDTIYDEFIKLTKCDEETAEKLKHSEMEIEKKLLYPRETIKYIFDKVVESGKIVIITSDMYLPRKILEEILVKNEITGYQKIYVSSEEKITKGSGRLFEKIAADFSVYGISPKEMLHLGDNQRADVDMPQRVGLRAYHLPKPASILASKDTFKEMYKQALENDDTYIVGALANFLFDDPYREFRKYTYGNGEETALGAVLYGPLLLVYVIWMLKMAEECKIDQLLMVYRDGYIIEKICNMLKDIFGVPKLQKIYLSRNIRYKFYAKDENGIADSLPRFPISKNLTVRNFIEKRLLIKEPETINEIWSIFRESGYDTIDDPLGDEKRYVHLFPALESYFYNAVKDDIKAIENYCKYTIGTYNNIGVVDVGYRGSVGDFLKNNLGVASISFQIFETSKMRMDDKLKNKINSFYRYGLSVVEKLQILHPLTEDIISVQEGSAYNICYNNGNFEIEREQFEEENKTLTMMQEGVLSFCEYAIKHLGKALKDMSLDNNIYVDSLLFRFLEKPDELDAGIIRKLKFEDSVFIKNSNENIYQKWYLSRGFKNAQINIPAADHTQAIQKDEEGISMELQPYERISKIHLKAIKICERLHIINYAISIKKWIRDPFKIEGNRRQIAEIFEAKLASAIKEIENLKDKNGIILVTGAMTSFDKGVCAYLNNLSNKLNKNQLILLSEANPKGTRNKVNFEAFMVPDFILKDKYQIDTGIKCPCRIKHKVDRIEYLAWAFNNLTGRHTEMEKDYAYLCIYYMQEYISRALDIINPEKIMIWNEFFAYHHIVKAVAQSKNIKICFMEFGSLPGTLSIENEGQMGKSFPGLYAEKFSKLDVSAYELENAKKVIEYIKKNKLNRNVQPINDKLLELKRKVKKERPILLYAGVNDFESGLNPYTIETQRYHSPFLKSSEEILPILAKISEQSNWNLIYKPHPIMARLNHCAENVPSNVIYITDIDINDVIDLADVVITILSQVSYVSLVRGKATLMLGHTQLKDKGCCYQAFSIDVLQEQLEAAVQNGYSYEMQVKFQKHVAQMLKYNLFYDYVQKEFIYGKSIDDAIDYLLSE